jgi:hypothetical protein
MEIIIIIKRLKKGGRREGKGGKALQLLIKYQQVRYVMQ